MTRSGGSSCCSAPVIALPFADSKAYTDRYGEPDKVQTGLGAGPDAWPVPYWTIDASMSVMTMLLAAEDVGLGALFFGVFRGERELRQRLGIPPGLELLGAMAIGHRARTSAATTPTRVAVRIVVDARRPRSFTGGAGRRSRSPTGPVDPSSASMKPSTVSCGAWQA